MKKYIIIILLTITTIMNLNAQSDRFFERHDEDRRESNDEWCKFVLLPQEHGVNYNYPADDVPVTTGAFLLMEMGLLYVMIKRNRNTDS
jgi:hypothetical protein